MRQPHLTIPVTLLLAAAMAPAFAADQVPQTTDQAAAQAQDAESLAPTPSDMAKAQQDRKHGHVPPRNNEKQTKIEAVRDENNRVTEYVVTPGSTHIPYSMENQAEQPINTTPGSNAQGTLGTTKLLKFGF